MKGFPTLCLVPSDIHLNKIIYLPAQVVPIHAPVVTGEPTTHDNCMVWPLAVYPIVHDTVAVPPNVVLVGVPTTPLLRLGGGPHNTAVDHDQTYKVLVKNSKRLRVMS